MSGENCTLSAAGFGSVNVMLASFSHGIEIVGTSDSARTRKAFYVSAVTSTAFSIVILCGSDKRRYSLLSLWLKSYGDRVSNPNGGVGPMRVQVPSRNFDRLAIPKTGVHFGEVWNDVARTIPLSFVGARSPGDFANPLASNFINSTDADGKYFYPGGEQLTAADDPEDTLYNQKVLSNIIDSSGLIGL